MKKLLVSGTALFLLGLLNGVVIPMFKNPRMGLSAHLAGVQNALVLLAFGAIWEHAEMSEAERAWCANLSIYSMYSIWFSLVLAAMWGTSSATPIAGAGYSGSAREEGIVNSLLYSGSGAIIISTIQLLRGFIRSGGK